MRLCGGPPGVYDSTACSQPFENANRRMIDPAGDLCRWAPYPSPVREYERKQFLERIGRDGATVGATIPETIDVEGEEVALREFVFEVKRLEQIPPGRQSEVAKIRTGLRRERQRRKHRLETADISTEEGERLVEEIIGIDRALNSLESLGPTDLEAEAATAEAADRKRWFKFLKTVLGRDENTNRRGGHRG